MFGFSLPTTPRASGEKTQQLGLSQSAQGRITQKILFSVAWYQGWGHSNAWTGVSPCGFFWLQEWSFWGDQTPYMMVQDSEGKIVCDSRTETPHLDGRSIAQENCQKGIY